METLHSSFWPLGVIEGSCIREPGAASVALPQRCGAGPGPPALPAQRFWDWGSAGGGGGGSLRTGRAVAVRPQPARPPPLGMRRVNRMAWGPWKVTVHRVQDRLGSECAVSTAPARGHFSLRPQDLRVHVLFPSQDVKLLDGADPVCPPPRSHAPHRGVLTGPPRPQ